MKMIKVSQGRAKFSPRIRNISKRPSYFVFWPGLSVVLLGLFAAITAFGQETRTALEQSRQPVVTLDTLASLPQIAPADAPRNGVFRSLAHPEWPPLPGNCGYPVWQVPDTDTFIVDDLASLTATATMMSQSAASSSSLPGGGVKGGGGTVAKSLPEISNYAKFAAQSFSVIDTNDAALNDPGLYQACLAFGNAPGTQPLLQIAQYQPGCLVFKASHFDYSAESRDFCLVVCDRVDTPLFKQIDLYTPANNIQNGGWLVQGSVPGWEVTDPMFIVVSNISRDYNAFFRVIPYDGPQIEITGAQPYDMVSNTITLRAKITDLSGITNEAFEVTVNGLPARYTVQTNNLLAVETEYHPNGLNNLYLNTGNAARICNPDNPPDNARLFFSSSATLPLDFENDTYLMFASDWCPPDMGTNYIYFSVNQARKIEASIYHPEDGRLVARFSGQTPSATTIVLPWNFTEADGVTPYTNDTYVVAFTATDPNAMMPKGNSGSPSIILTNLIDRNSGIRPPGGCLLTYQWENPEDPSSQYLNDKTDQVIGGDLLTLYRDIYKNWSLTQYGVGDVGPNRNLAQCDPYNSPGKTWRDILLKLTNSTFSELTIAQAHGHASSIGGGKYLTNTFVPGDLVSWVKPYNVKNDWRLRKATMFACYSGELPLTTADRTYRSWPDACGIRPAFIQNNSYMYKNCGLFFGDTIPQGITNVVTGQIMVTAAVAELLDQTWVCGQNQYPGGCDPTYSFDFAINAVRGQYLYLDKSNPLRAGFGFCVYTSNLDEELKNLNISHVKNPQH